MNMQNRIGLPLTVAVTIILSGTAGIAGARQAQPVPASSPASAPQFLPGTESTATYRLDNGTLTVRAGMPAEAQDDGPPPTFKALDSNHDGRISEAEAQAYPPLDGDFLYASGGAKTIGPAQYQKWVANHH